MKRNKTSHKVLMLLAVIPLLGATAGLLLSCSAARKAAESKSETTSPSPPPPPPPPPVIRPVQESPTAPQKTEVIVNPRVVSVPGYRITGNDTVYFYPEVRAQFPGGAEAMTRFKRENLKVPPEILELGFQGSVFVTFLVGKDGKLSEFRIPGSGISPFLDAEALRVAKLLPQYWPAMENGRAVVSETATMFTFYPPVKDGEAPKEVFVVVEEMPQFPGGDSALIKFVADNLRYPTEAKEKNIQGRVITRFCINYQGGVEQIQVIRGVNKLLDDEAVRVISILPKWKPGKQGGVPVNVWYALPVTFSLDDGQTKAPVPPSPPSAPPPPQAPPAAPVYYDEPPQFPGGETELLKFIMSEIEYPKAAKDKGIKGVVRVRITISETGKVENPMISKGVSPELDNEAIRVISRLPDWKPAKLKGKPVKISYTIPVSFK